MYVCVFEYTKPHLASKILKHINFSLLYSVCLYICTSNVLSEIHKFLDAVDWNIIFEDWGWWLVCLNLSRNILYTFSNHLLDNNLNGQNWIELIYSCRIRFWCAFVVFNSDIHLPCVCVCWNVTSVSMFIAQMTFPRLVRRLTPDRLAARLHIPSELMFRQFYRLRLFSVESPAFYLHVQLAD